MRRVKQILQLLVATALASALPTSGWACSACMVGDPKTAGTYLGMTLVMSALPMILICGIGYWLWRRYL